MHRTIDAPSNIVHAVRSLLAAAACCCVPLALPAAAETDARSAGLEELVVTGARMLEPLRIVADPKLPRQPLPAHDGADFLKTVPGFNVIRKGGTDGDPVFRGMAASRLNIVADGQPVLGGCGNRMDPPTAYIFPEAFDRIVVVKGPQTVLQGPGNSAATVMFEREPVRFTSPAAVGTGSALAGSFGRTDLVGEMRAGTQLGYAQLTGTRSESDDYTDGDGRRVNSSYLRWSGTAALGWTPDERTRLELSGTLSDGEAAYADRGMDGVKFDRESALLRFERDVSATGVLERVQAEAFYAYVDHVMDNYSLRTFVPSMMMPNPSVMNPDRRTSGGRVLLDLRFGDAATASVGLDAQENRHTQRMSMNQPQMPYESMPRAEDARFRQAGVFGELTVDAGSSARVIAGLRADDWQARDSREMLSLGMGMTAPNPTAGHERNETLWSGFARYERDLARAPLTLYAGLGRVERFPDYWELVSAGKESVDSPSAFDSTRPEKTTQLDAGLLYERGRLSFSLSGFYSDIGDYVLIESNYPKGMRRTTVTRNVDATTWGGEADAVIGLTRSLRLTGTLAYTRGENDTDGTALAQMPPLEGRLGLEFSRGSWSAGALVRAVAGQDRIALNQGNIVGQDLGTTPGFTILSLNAGWRPRDSVIVTAGVDNLFDVAYAEHLSRGGAMVAGYEQTTRVNEPGRTLWLKLGVDLR